MMLSIGCNTFSSSSKVTSPTLFPQYSYFQVGWYFDSEEEDLGDDIEETGDATQCCGLASMDLASVPTETCPTLLPQDSQDSLISDFT